MKINSELCYPTMQNFLKRFRHWVFGFFGEWKVRNMLIFQKKRSTWTTTLPLAKIDNAERNAQAYLDTTQVPTMMVAR